MKIYTNWLQNVLFFLMILLVGGCNNASQQSNEETASADTTNVPNDTDIGSELPQKTILFFGNSLTAGYGLDLSQAFPELIQQKLDSLAYDYKVINAGLSGETTSGGRERIDWVMQQAVDVFVLELGANDGLRGIPLEETEANLQAIIDYVRAKSPKVKILLAGMQIPPNMGQPYIQQFQQIYPRLAEKNEVALIPFLLEGVAGEPTLNLEDGIHPNETGQKIVAETVWQYLKPLLVKNES